MAQPPVRATPTPGTEAPVGGPSPAGEPARRAWLRGNVPGMLLMAGSTGCMACMYVAIRMVPKDIHPFEIVFFRNLFALIMLVTWHVRGGLSVLHTKHLRLHGLRGALNVVAMLAFFYAVTITPLADVAALGFTAPLFASVMALFVLRERMRPHRLAVIALGFIGAVVVLRPGTSGAHLGALLLLFSSAVWAIALMVIKVLARTDTSGTITIYMVLVMTPLALIPAAFVWVWPGLEHLGWFALIALLGTLGQLGLAQSFRLADVTAVLPLDFLKLLWGSLLGFALFAEVPDLWTWVGGSMIFGSTLYLALRESRRL